MNFFKGNVSSSSFAMETISVPLGGYKFDKPASGSLEGVLGIRPEHIAVGEDAKKMPFQIESEIEIVEPMGSETVGYTKVNGQTVTFRCSSDIPLEPGQKVTLGFDPARGSVFDAQSGVRL
jgi:multiple sugar transport system ATP-binding protein